MEMEEYKKIVDGQHAPEALILDTIRKMKAEEEKQKNETVVKEERTNVEEMPLSKPQKKKNSGKIIKIAFPTVAAVAVLALVVTTYAKPEQINYQAVEDEMMRDISDLDETENTISVEECKERFGIDAENLIDGASLQKCEQSEKGNVILSYKVKESPVVLEISEEALAVPDGLLEEKSEIAGKKVYVGTNGKEDTFYAAFHLKDTNAYMTASHMQKEEFEEILKKMLKK